jgi:hypothetical protein
MVVKQFRLTSSLLFYMTSGKSGFIGDIKQ